MGISTAIRFDQVSKRFTIHTERSRSFQELAVNLFRRTNGSPKIFQALQDVSFEIAAGETVGLIGPNGAGKSTILKLVAQIIRPSAGRIEVNGRVNALVELGVGFHPDLTGRENVYLNGAILGMSRAEIHRRLDEIIAFAEIGRYIDVPVKHYSSGMYVRLGFSVAVNTCPDILLIDEVLSVGDAAFQRKCLEQVDRLRREGVTILLVSHDLNIVPKVCRRAIWMDKGKVMTDGASEPVVRQYLWRSYKEGVVMTPTTDQRWGSGEVLIEHVRLAADTGEARDFFVTGEPFIIEIGYRAQQRVERPVFGVAIHSSDGTHVTGTNTLLARYEIPTAEDVGAVQYIVPSLPLLEGTYYVSVAATNHEDTQMFDYHDRLYPFRVLCLKGDAHGVGMITLGGRWMWSEQTQG